MIGGLYARLRTGPMRAVGRAVVASVPDVTVTRRVPHVGGRLAFGLRRHHWLLGPDCFAGHGRTLGLFEHLARDGDALYDVGANIGYYARWSLQNLPIARLIAFEPMAKNLPLLRRNRELLAAPDRMTVVPIALSDRDGEADLQTDDQSDGSAALSRVTGGTASEGRAARGMAPLVERVREARLDGLLLDRRPLRHVDGPADLPPPTLMKIDTEGAEHLVLAGARRTLERHRPRLILAMHGRDRAEESLRLLADLGYAVAGWSVADGGHAWTRFGPGDAGDMADNNCVASAEESDVATPAPVLELATSTRREPPG